MTPVSELNLLVVDDDDFAIEIFLAALEGLGIEECATALSGQEALEIIKSHQDKAHFDLIICDIEMPDMDGLELLRHLADEQFAGKVAVISGLDSEILRMAKDLGKAHKLNVIGSIQKPIQKQALQALLAQVKQEQKQSSQLVSKRDISKADILEALANNEFSLNFQPKIDIQTEKVVGAEALIRWFSRKYDCFIGPDDFIPVAEASKVINDITQFVIRHSIQEVKRLKALGHALQISINVSMVNLSELNFANDLHQLLQAEGVEPSELVLEITETALVEDVTSVLEVLTRLKMIGIKLSIDDFGTGYSSMSQLQSIPFSELKIDRSFVFGAGENNATRHILESSASLAQQLKICSVAEGVETLDDWNRVAKLGINLVQGYFISRPLASDDFHAWLGAWKGLPV